MSKPNQRHIRLLVLRVQWRATYGAPAAKYAALAAAQPAAALAAAAPRYAAFDSAATLAAAAIATAGGSVFVDV